MDRVGGEGAWNVGDRLSSLTLMSMARVPWTARAPPRRAASHWEAIMKRKRKSGRGLWHGRQKESRGS